MLLFIDIIYYSDLVPGALSKLITPAITNHWLPISNRTRGRRQGVLVKNQTNRHLSHPDTDPSRRIHLKATPVPFLSCKESVLHRILNYCLLHIMPPSNSLMAAPSFHENPRGVANPRSHQASFLGLVYQVLKVTAHPIQDVREILGPHMKLTLWWKHHTRLGRHPKCTALDNYPTRWLHTIKTLTGYCPLCLTTLPVLFPKAPSRPEYYGPHLP